MIALLLTGAPLAAPAKPPTANSKGRLVKGRLVKGLGAPAAELLRTAEEGWAARLKVIGVRQATRATFKQKRIMGYPLVTPLRRLSKEEVRRLGALVSADAAYLDVRRRCANRHWLGARLLRGKAVVELVLGIPCDQLLFAAKVDGKTRRWGSVITPKVAKALRALLGGKRSKSQP